MITHGLSRGSGREVGSGPSMTRGAASTVSRHALRAPVPPASATASTATGSSSGATMRAFRTRGPCGCASTCSRHGSSGPRNGAGVANAPAPAISRPYVRVTLSGTPDPSDWRQNPKFAFQCRSITGRFPQNGLEGSAPRPPSSQPLRVQSPTEAPSTVGHFTLSGSEALPRTLAQASRVVRQGPVL